MQKVYVNVDCANIYRDNAFRSAIDSQAVLWEELKVKTKEKQFSLVVCEDSYQGWINNNQINPASINNPKEMVTCNHAFIYEEADENTLTVREAGAGCYIPILRQINGWYQIILPDGEKGWIKRSVFDKISGDQNKNMLVLAKRFLGVPYFWGGKTAKGLDCSGFCQLLHKMVGIKIRRDSPMQFEDAQMVSDNFLDGTPGDLLFFAEYGERITHVALKLSEKEIIHARGRVRINSLDKDSELFDSKLIDTFVAVKTFFDR